ncbi:NAD(P)H-dependent oxidoreductase [Bartonella sp. HY329]|uniref:NADPH-dependent FMN reductase n=1 Tax=unclassified Bartonella TaxID=2645622 RepID=UPI0021C9D3F3|nr:MULTISPECIES: NADPH-dependent FMN reductase [unclassified Bartonella]UXM96275.1 NAD(P)H-dependent oxidoreductase [Bartonella sp. HY329]UXN10599.1 NAD(P)H-dependent oxidoreductase [Bartonella sp. HY328]
MKPHIQIIIGSVRKGRIGPHIANWINKEIATDFSTEIIDLKDWHLPMDDEPNLPADGIYINDHTKLWSKKISGGDAYIFVFPQYNWGYPAALKNAIDHLYHEWADKPAVIVSYANMGGGKAANQLREVLQSVHIKVTTSNIEIKLSEIDFSQNISDDTYSKILSKYKDNLILETNKMFK